MPAIPNYLGAQQRGFRPLSMSINPGGDTASNPDLGFYDPNTGAWVGNPMYDGSGNPSDPTSFYPSVPGTSGPAGTDLGPNPLPGTDTSTGGQQVYLPPSYDPSTAPTGGDTTTGDGSNQTTSGSGGMTVSLPPTWDSGSSSDTGQAPVSSPYPNPPSGPTYTQNTGNVSENPRAGSTRVPPDYQNLPSWTVTGTGTAPPPDSGGTGTGSTPNPAPSYGGPTYTGPPTRPGRIGAWGGTPRPTPVPGSSPAPTPGGGAATPSIPSAPTTSGGSLGQSNSQQGGAIGVAPSMNSLYAPGLPGPMNYAFTPIEDNPSKPMSTPNYAGMRQYGFNPYGQGGQGNNQQGPGGVPNYTGPGPISQGLNAANVNTPNWLRAALGLGGL